MTPDQFIKRLESENTSRKGTHKIGKPAAADAIKKWQAKHPQFPLPKGMVQLLQRANGITILCDEHVAKDVGGALRLLALKELRWAPAVLQHDQHEPDDETPPGWLGFGVDPNSDWSPVLDTANGQVRICTQVGVDENHEVLDSLEAFLDWIVDTQLDPFQEELAAEAELKKRLTRKKQKAPIVDLEEVHIFADANSSVDALSISADGTRAVIAMSGRVNYNEDPSGERSLRVYDVPKRKELAPLQIPTSAASWGKQNADGTSERIAVTQPRGAYGAAISPDGAVVLASFEGDPGDDRFYVFNVSTGAVLRSMPSLLPSWRMLFSPDKSLLLLVDGYGYTVDGRVQLRDAKSLELVAEWVAHRPHTLAAVFTPDGKQIITGGQDRLIQVWEVPTGKSVLTLPKQAYPVTGLAISPDGKLLLIGSEAHRGVRVMDLATQTVTMDLPGHTRPTQHMQFSPDGKLAVTADFDSVVRIWDIAAGGVQVAKYDKHHHKDIFGVRSAGIHFLPDGRHLLSASQDHTLRLLRLPT